MADTCLRENQVIFNTDFESSRFIQCTIEVLNSLNIFYQLVKDLRCNDGVLKECKVEFWKQAFKSQKMNQPYDCLKLYNSMKESLIKRSVGSGVSCDFIDIIEFVLHSLHSCIANPQAMNDRQNANNYGCNHYCIAHKLFSLPITENYYCACGAHSINESDALTFSQNCKMDLILSGWEIRPSSHIATVPRFILKSNSIASNSSIRGKLISELAKVFELYPIEHMCKPEHNPKMQQKVVLSLESTPEVYLLNLNWNNIEATHLNSFLSTLSINKKFNIKEIYDAPSNMYTIKGIVFSRKNKFQYALRKTIGSEEGWMFIGLSQQCGYLQLLEEVMIMKYSPVCVVYEKGDLQEFKEIQNYSLQKIEMLAQQCDNYEKYSGRELTEIDTECSGWFSTWGTDGPDQGKPNRKLIETRSRIDSMGPRLSSCNMNENLQKPLISSSAKDNISEFDKSFSEKQNFTEEWIETAKNKQQSDSHLTVSKSKEIAIAKTVNNIEDDNEWKCKCGEQNKKDWDVCSSCCKSLRPGLTGWICDYCKFLNDDYIIRCKGCELPKNAPKTAIRDYWKCQYCGKFNLEPESTCECGKVRLNEDEYIKSTKKDFEEKKSKENEDWICSSCSTTNKINSYNCGYCSQSKDFSEKSDFRVCTCRVSSHNSVQSRVCNICNKTKPKEQLMNESMHDSFKEKPENLKQGTDSMTLQTSLKSVTSSKKPQQDRTRLVRVCHYCRNTTNKNLTVCSSCNRTLYS